MTNVAAAHVASAPKIAEAHVASAASSVPSASVKPEAAKPASPDDDAIVAALKATLDKEEKDAEQKVVTNPSLLCTPQT
jgi:hypothetical protein